MGKVKAKSKTFKQKQQLFAFCFALKQFLFLLDFLLFTFSGKPLLFALFFRKQFFKQFVVLLCLKKTTSQLLLPISGHHIVLKSYQFFRSFVERRPPPRPKIRGKYSSLMTTFQPMKSMASLNGLVGRY